MRPSYRSGYLKGLEARLKSYLSFWISNATWLILFSCFSSWGNILSFPRGRDFERIKGCSRVLNRSTIFEKPTEHFQNSSNLFQRDCTKMTLNEITFRVDKIHNVLVLAIWMKSNKSPWSLSFNSSKCPKLAKIKFGSKLAVQSIKTFTSVENAVSIFSLNTLGARGFYFVRGDRIERRSRVAKRREKNLWHQRITTSLPCRRQFPLIDIRSLLFSHFDKTGLAKIIAQLTNSSPFKKRFFNRPSRFPGSNYDSGEINGNRIGVLKKLNCLSQRSLADQHYSLWRFLPLANEKTSGIQGTRWNTYSFKFIVFLRW